MTLAGLLTIRNGLSLDYSWKEAGESLLGVCDELVINDVASTDGTWQSIEAWASREPRITLVQTEWTDPKGTDQWWPEVLNRTRQHAKSQMILHLDADEVLGESQYIDVRWAADRGKPLFFKRLNFWKDPQHLIPEGHCCGTKVLRMAPKNMPIPSDYPYGPAEETMKLAEESNIRIYHYGFLRRRDAFFQKARAVQRIWADTFDPRLAEAEKAQGNWMANEIVAPWVKDVTEYHGSHPKIIHAWLRDRNYEC